MAGPSFTPAIQVFETERVDPVSLHDVLRDGCHGGGKELKNSHCHPGWGPQIKETDSGFGAPNKTCIDSFLGLARQTTWHSVYW